MYDSPKQDYVKPAVNPAEVFYKTAEYEQKIYQEQENRKALKESAQNREINMLNEEYNNYVNEAASTVYNRAEYLKNMKNALMTECIMKLFTESVTSPMTNQDKIIARNMVSNFVKENGASKLVNEFATKNYVLSEFSRITSKYYDKVLEKCECGDICGEKYKELKLDNTIGTEFFSELEDIDTSDASKLIRDRVADAVSEFIDGNLAAKMDYEELISAAQDQIDKPAMSPQEESAALYKMNMAQRAIIAKKNSREKNVLHVMAESLSKASYKNDALKKKYFIENNVEPDVDKIVDDATLMYTMLEMCNTMNMIKVNEEFISKYLDSLN